MPPLFAFVAGLAVGACIGVVLFAALIAHVRADEQRERAGPAPHTGPYPLPKDDPAAFQKELNRATSWDAVVGRW